MNQKWLNASIEFEEALNKIVIPDEELSDVEYVKLTSEQDLNEISEIGGCYWIWTNEPIVHTMHKHPLPKRFENGEVIYNGIAKDNLKGRIKAHLFSSLQDTWSGISVDIYTDTDTTSHRKKACSSTKNAKVPYLLEDKDYRPIKDKETLKSLYLSKVERDFIETVDTSNSQIFFRNGINITEDKHKDYEFRVYFLTGLNPHYMEYIEAKWRNFGMPRLCSYISGR